jgi:hypothetical protein
VQHVDLVDHVHGSLSLPRLYRGIDALYDQICGFLRNPVRPGSPAVVPAVVLTDEDVTTATERR